LAFRFISINKELSVCLALMLHGILVRIVGLCRVPVASFQMRRLSLASTDGETGRSPPNARGSGDHELDVALDFALIGRDVALDLALIGPGVHLTHTHSAPRHPRPQCELVSEAISEPGGEGSGEGSGEHCSGRWLDGRASSSARHRSAIACISARRALALPQALAPSRALALYRALAPSRALALLRGLAARGLHDRGLIDWALETTLGTALGTALARELEPPEWRLLGEVRPLDTALVLIELRVLIVSS
jgi:hypothetical protein